MKLRFKVRGVEEVQEYLRQLPRGTLKVALRAIGEYMLGNERHGLKHYEPYKYVTRKKAYGQTFQSEKQRRWFWAQGGPDMIGNHRTRKTAEAWHFRETNNGRGVTFENPTEGAKWLWSDKRQARQLGLVGHKKLTAKLMSSLAGAIRHANAKVKEYLKRK